MLIPGRLNYVNICLCLVTLTVLVQVACAGSSKILPEASAEEIKNNAKILLTKLNIRDIPAAQDRAEKYLAKLFKEERELKAEIEDIQKNLDYCAFTRKTRRTDIRFNAADIRKSDAAHKVLQLTNMRMADLDEKKAYLISIQNAIVETKKIIKNPENYIFVPTNFGKDPEGQRDMERELLIKDRENMQFRYQVAAGEIDAPLWMTDSF